MTPNAKQTLYEAAKEQRQKCRDWLLPHMRNGKSKTFTKDEYRAMAMKELGASKSAFDVGWIWAIEDAGRRDWYKPKPRGRTSKKKHTF